MKVLVAYDGSNFADAAIDDLQRAGLPEPTEALVVCVSDGKLAVPDQSRESESDTSWRSTLDGAECLAEKATARLRASFPQWAVSSKALFGSPAKIIPDTSAAYDAAAFQAEQKRSKLRSRVVRRHGAAIA